MAPKQFAHRRTRAGSRQKFVFVALHSVDYFRRALHTLTRARKQAALSEALSLQVRAEFFNILNHATFDTPNPVLFMGAAANASAGVITETANRERQVQFALKLLF